MASLRLALCLTVLTWVLCPRAEAIPLRVVTAAELRIGPRVTADRGAVIFSVHLQDDRRSPLARRAVRLQITSDPSRIRETRELSTGPSGEAETTLTLSAQDRTIEVTGEFTGDRSTSPAASSLRFSPDAPFVTLELAIDPVIEARGPAVRAVITVQVGQVVRVSPAGLTVSLVSDGRSLASGVTDASGRAELRVPSSALGEPGVRRVHPSASLPPETVIGPERNLVVRARTAVTLASAMNSRGRVTLTGALATATSPVRDASIRIMVGARAVAGARTDARGNFEALVPLEVLVEHDVVVRAVFDPTEPWYEGSMSAYVTLTGPTPPRIGWSWLAAPLALALTFVAGFWLRSVRRATEPTKTLVLASEPGWSRVERVSLVSDGGVHVRLVVLDHASALPVQGAHVRLTREGAWSPLGDPPTVMNQGRRMSIEVGAEGYAPRAVEASLPGPGEYMVRVSLRSWREELFDRARRFLKSAGKDATSVTPREALAASGARGPEAAELVGLVERGCYGPEAPGAREVAEADALVLKARASGP